MEFRSKLGGQRLSNLAVLDGYHLREKKYLAVFTQNKNSKTNFGDLNT